MSWSSQDRSVNVKACNPIFSNGIVTRHHYRVVLRCTRFRSPVRIERRIEQWKEETANRSNCFGRVALMRPGIAVHWPVTGEEKYF